MIPFRCSWNGCNAFEFDTVNGEIKDFTTDELYRHPVDFDKDRVAARWSGGNA